MAKLQAIGWRNRLQLGSPAFPASNFGFIAVLEREFLHKIRLALVALGLWGLALPALAQSPSPSYDCVLEPSMKLKLATPVAGVLRSVEADRGDAVKIGQPVARLESAIEEANVELAAARAASEATVDGKRTRLEFLRRKSARQSDLFKRGAGTEATRDEAETDMRFAANELQEAESNQKIAKLEHARAVELLKQRTIVSPIEGVVVERQLGRGEYAYEQAPIMTVAQLDPLFVEVYVPVALYGSIAIGDKATVRPELPKAVDREAVVSVVDPVFDARSGTFGVRLSMKNADRRTPAGARCKVKFEPLAKAP
ncbi:efflux RND transporter periplasmic adaptor subunit [Terrarubrum flagellatum]|uniref:efflux RND transporter periplasmic adaptor subunit n=1 Tax=Terrirubrum flagellatum TaxID=2895980 RepID=UPI00314500BC